MANSSSELKAKRISEPEPLLFWKVFEYIEDHGEEVREPLVLDLFSNLVTQF